MDSSQDVALKFEEFKSKIEKCPLGEILELIKHTPNDELKQWNEDQWCQVLGVIEAKTESKGTSVPKTLQFLEWMLDLVSKVYLPGYMIIVVFVLKSIGGYILDYSSDNDQSAVNQGKIKSIIRTTLTALSSPSGIKPNTPLKKEREFMEKALKYLAIIAMRKPNFMDIKDILDIWKSFLNIFTNYSKRFGLKNEKINALLADPVAYLLKEVGSKIDLLHKVETLKQPIEKVDKYLRVTNFYMKLLRQFMPKMKNKEFVASKDFSKSYKKAKLLPDHLKGTEIEELLKKYVEEDFDILLCSVYENDDVIKSLTTFPAYDNDNCNCILIESYLSAVISSGDGIFISSNCERFKEIFETYFKNSKLRSNSQSYEMLIDQFAALAMLEENPNILRYLRENVLRNSFWIGYASTDVLILLQRYQYKQSEQCNDAFIKEFNFWKDCLSKFALFSSDIKQIHIVRLLKNCLKLNKSLMDSQVIRKTTNENLSIGDLKLFLATGLHKHIGWNDSYLNNELRQLLKELSNGNGSIESYYATIAHIQLLEIHHSSYNEQTRNLLQELMEKIFNADENHWKEFSLFISSSLKLIVKFVEMNSSIDAEKFLGYLNAANGKAAVMFPGSLKYFQFYSNCSSSLLKQRAILALKENRIDTESCMTINLISDAIKHISEESFNHNCHDNSSPVEPPQSKRLCFGFK